MATIPHVFASATSPIPLSQLDDNFTALNAAKAELTASTTPLMDGTAAIGSATTAAKADHVHPTDTTRATVAQATSAVAITGGTINGTPIGATTPSTGAFTTLTASGSISSSDAITTTSGGAAISAASGYAILGATTVGSYAPTGAVYVSGTTLTHNCGTSGYGWNNSANSAQLMTLGGAGNLAVTGNISSTSDANIHGLTVGLGGGALPVIRRLVRVLCFQIRLDIITQQQGQPLCIRIRLDITTPQVAIRYCITTPQGITTQQVDYSLCSQTPLGFRTQRVG